MHRPPKAAGLTAVIVSLLAVLLASAVVEGRVPIQGPHLGGRPRTADAIELARSAPEAIEHGTTNESCTGWRSTYVPPPTINVMRTHGPNKGHVETVDFPTYVGWVLSTEWTAYYPLEALKVGAIAVKQYAWYFTIVYRGGMDAFGNCYDVTDNTNDQYYDPDNIAHPRPGPNKVHLEAMAATWNVTLRKWSQKTGTSRFFVTGYRSGNNVPCGMQHDGYRLYQHSILKCAQAPNSLSYEQILRIYLSNLEVVRPGAHDVIGTSQGDISVLAPSDGEFTSPRIYQAVTPAGVSPAASSGMAVATAGLLGSASFDMNRDGREDLVTMVATNATSIRIDVALSDGVADYQQATTWLPSTSLGVPVADARLLPGDFNADGRPDIGILVAVPAPAGDEPGADPQARLLVVAQRRTGLPAAPVIRWTGSLDLTRSDAWAADVNGDGGADLLVAQDLSAPGVTPAGVHLAAAMSAPPQPTLAPLATWFDAPDLVRGKMLATIGDINRDGRDDLFVAYQVTPGRSRIDVIRANRKQAKRLTLWTALAADPMPLAKLKLESADVNYDGQSDIVIYRDRGADGTGLVVLRGTYTRLRPYATFTDATLDWSTATPY